MIKNYLKFVKAIMIVIAFTFLFSCGKNTTLIREFDNLILEDSIILEYPLFRFQSFNENIYCYNFQEKGIHLLNRGLSILDTLGSWGDGPKENILIRDYFPISDECVAIFDVEKNSFKIQDFNDSVYFYHKFSKNIQKGIYLGENELIIGSIGGKTNLEFDSYNLEINKFLPIPKINNLFKEDFSALIYEGIVRINNNKIYFTSYFTSFWFIYDVSSEKIHTGKYVFDFEKPKILEIGTGIMLDNAPELIYDTFFFNNYIAIISNFGNRAYPNQRILDIYSINDFKYIKSFPLPDLNNSIPEEGFQYSKNQIGVLYEDIVYIFELNFP